MNARCSVSCIVPPHILQKLLESTDPQIRGAALGSLLATTRFRAERRILSEFGFTPNIAGGMRRTIYDCQHGRVLNKSVRVCGEGDASPKDPTVKRAYDGLGKTYDFYKTVFSRNSIDGRGMRLDGYVHFARAYNNAFWNGRQMVFGDGDGRVFIDFTKSLDVIAHELTHGFTEFTANLAYHNQSGALNESISDVFGSLVKQWSLGQRADEADWLIGAEVFTPDIQGDALRSMKEPGTAYNDPTIGRDPQPGHMDDYKQSPDTEEGDWGGVHINSGIPNHAFYILAANIGGHAWEAPGHIWYESVKASTETTDFQEFADTTFHMAGRLYGAGSVEQKAVRAAWGEVGIRVNLVSGVAARAAMTADDADSVAALGRKLEGLAKQVSALKTEVAQLKEGRYPDIAET
ncbi:M4 family metallopeptidase [Vitiosangium sp. GDMCC 1.1324]|uniref:M4 family metallopeptidase n=1 Tax=Vitiosangium sp. (strain GDMCC 1.1324) TaxID=2138576 RepID=UPI000D3D7A79|nr:M4 family metallopeptidase [Vitiosangium sp. GDMCC 1.1324]PTL78156.1 peptidase M4 [Vitiosangium sp. GDMCC 1.1324]